MEDLSFDFVLNFSGFKALLKVYAQLDGISSEAFKVRQLQNEAVFCLGYGAVDNAQLDMGLRC